MSGDVLSHSLGHNGTSEGGLANASDPHGKKIKIPPCATIREYAILHPSLSRKEVSDMVSGPRYTGRDEKSELGPATGHGDRR